jgi:hypothetical protein
MNSEQSRNLSSYRNPCLAPRIPPEFIRNIEISASTRSGRRVIVPIGTFKLYLSLETQGGELKCLPLDSAAVRRAEGHVPPKQFPTKLSGFFCDQKAMHEYLWWPSNLP